LRIERDRKRVGDIIMSARGEDFRITSPRTKIPAELVTTYSPVRDSTTFKM
jgi:hypothetical protein